MTPSEKCNNCAISSTGKQTLRTALTHKKVTKAGVSVAAGDLDGNGFAEIITSAGPGGAPQVNVYASRTYGLLSSFLAYAPQFTGGVYVAVGELTGDTFAEIITGAGSGGGSQVNVFNSQSLQLLTSFFAYAQGFEGGVRVGACDFNGDGVDEIITGAGPGGGPHVKVFDFDLTLVDQFFAGDVGFLGGVFVS